MPAAAARDRIDLLHVTYVSPPVCGCRTVVSVHDISFEKYPEFFAPRVRLMLKTLVPRSVRRASAVITISEHTRRELRDRYGLEPDRVAVTHLAAAPQFATITDAAARADVRRRYGLGPKYLLALGNLQPRKNLSRLVHAYTEARRQGHLRDVQLVLAGKAEWRESDLFAQVRASPYAPNVIFPGYVDDADLPALYAGAFAFVYPSVYEGFGLPPLEAMACGTPVVCSNAASLPEVTGDAALSVDPHDAASITAALVRLELEPQLADDLRERGRRRAAEFTWTRCAEETLVVYRRAASAPRRRP